MHITAPINVNFQTPRARLASGLHHPPVLQPLRLLESRRPVCGTTCDAFYDASYFTQITYHDLKYQLPGAL